MMKQAPLGDDGLIFIPQNHCRRVLWLNSVVKFSKYKTI